MNVLYIGPYKENSIHGLSSINIIYSLKNKCDLTIRNIDLSAKNIKYLNPDKDLILLENKPLNHTYDIIIQHAPVDSLFPVSLSSTRHYSIPIISYLYNSYYKQKYQNILSKFYSVLVDNTDDVAYIKNYCLDKKTKLFRHSDTATQFSQINIYKKDSYKFYTFIDDNNINSISKIILSFILLQKRINDCLLIVAVNNKKHIKPISNKIEELTKQIKINYLNNYIHIFNTDNIIENVYNIHEHGDCCIDIKSETNSNFHTNIAKLYNNSIISNESLDMRLDTAILNSTIYNINDSSPVLNIKELSVKMLNNINMQPNHNIETIPTIDSVIFK